MTEQEKLERQLKVLYELQPAFGFKVINNVIQNLESQLKYLKK